jgi:5-methylcytosine-specific restriction endonuclease McrBC GTP-binding regulatory subunit McrB
MIFQGPPGTGKTFVAEKLAWVLASEGEGFVDTVQLHPAYTYEDFILGIRPQAVKGQLTFEYTPGRFLNFCREAAQLGSESPCVLIVDEINRANLPRVLGELLYLLEYRDKRIPLAGSDVELAIPPNVYIIGTMNTADRSIALVDHALRRRFTFVTLSPDYEVLTAYLERQSLKAEPLVGILKRINSTIANPNYEVGISFFMKDGASLSTTIEEIWKGEIEPYLEEYFYDSSAKIDPFRWSKVADVLLPFQAPQASA